MIEAIKEFFSVYLGIHWGVFLCSMIPIIELRGAIPLGTAGGLPWWLNYIIAVVGNFAPVPFILLFIGRIIELMKKVKFLKGFALWLERRAEKNKGKVENYSFWGLVALVAIPLPGTGAWTGSLVAALFGFKMPKAMLAIALGILIAGAIVTLISYGVLGFLSFLI